MNGDSDISEQLDWSVVATALKDGRDIPPVSPDFPRRCLRTALGAVASGDSRRRDSRWLRVAAALILLVGGVALAVGVGGITGTQASREDNPPEKRAPSASNQSFAGVAPSTPSTTTQEESMRPITSAKTAAGIAAASLALAASGDEYQFIVSGDPTAVATAGVSAGESATGPLDVRERAVAESTTMALTSIKPSGFVLVIR